MVNQLEHDRIKLLCSKHHPFLLIFRDLHEKYYTTTYNSIVKRDDAYVVETFNRLSILSNHSKKCLLTILGNVIASVHFNLDRTKLNSTSYESYMKSVQEEISNTISIIDLSKLFDHTCIKSDDQLQPITDDEKFITIEISTISNNSKKNY